MQFQRAPNNPAIRETELDGACDIMDFFDVMLFSLVSRHRPFDIICSFRHQDGRMGLKKTEDRNSQSFGKGDTCPPKGILSRPTKLSS
jgi:hypothetical protein